MNILFVCRGNTCRSPMSEGLLIRDLAAAGKKATVESAGILEKRDGEHPNPCSIACMVKAGIDISRHRRRYAGDLFLTDYHRTYATESEIRDELIRLGAPPDRIEVLCESIGGVPNPFSAKLPVDGQDIAKYISCAAVLADESTRIVSTL